MEPEGRNHGANGIYTGVGWKVRCSNTESSGNTLINQEGEIMVRWIFLCHMVRFIYGKDSAGFTLSSYLGYFVVSKNTTPLCNDLL